MKREKKHEEQSSEPTCRALSGLGRFRTVSFPSHTVESAHRSVTHENQELLGVPAAVPSGSVSITGPPNIRVTPEVRWLSFGHHEKKRKKQDQEPHEHSKKAKKMTGQKAKLYHEKRHAENKLSRRMTRGPPGGLSQ